MKKLSALLSLLVCCLCGFAQRQIPILCYHQIRDFKAKDSRTDKQYIIPPAVFKAQMKMLADSGYQTVLPDGLLSGKLLPAKPIMLTFDDTNADQFKNGLPVLESYGFKGVFFIITGKIGTHPWFMNAAQIKQLSAEGHVIGCHTQSHTDFRHLKPVEFEPQIAASKKKLEDITGKVVDYFAFPFGYWNSKGLPELKKIGFKAAFQLDAPRDKTYPNLTMRRIIASGLWTSRDLFRNIKSGFTGR
ncbi:polysaccharide deacetylase family protein [Mucilaginibacter rubeus]|uniref:Polysaccharide deacetylase family protein n=1 Tax=Mucilaginibacter rubeus TaxID=2027860 RepID=A0AAE6MKU0_9SPHI|nr:MULTISPECIES: polysaccharide deacetylase family protein [Mucilaginibacter]QEM06829.1 polysaccharide deacetylase family protein [Mucilaginibacter rubeus]QEM19418.1 polysaccharide deacetylase family protein [Mucilaginibacter gossypii]QTE44034.1 polysaccharide deacetylase family protein [Mucilaginibacter rubeus]QTE50635.1 polysaccharide deacetylase family protein [Mucilaginibacter rubeus]QTE55719.1 polysaccharide deacetylase family protein [Mucilaginibacter rubeus]